MPMSSAELLQLIDKAIASRRVTGDPIGDGRRLFLIHLRQLIEKHGLPLPSQVGLNACAMPFIFQELNYDDYDWSERTAQLGHLEDMVEIDVVVWSGGLQRKELTDAQYEDYRRYCHRAIDYRTPR